MHCEAIALGDEKFHDALVRTLEKIVGRTRDRNSVDHENEPIGHAK